MSVSAFLSLVLFGLNLVRVLASSQITLGPLSSKSDASSSSVKNAVQNAPHILNSIHSAMRQWGSSFHHNGMSYFPVTIPANTLVYHGDENPDPVTGLEWASFEIEHASLFAKYNDWVPPNEKHLDHGPSRHRINGYLHTYRIPRPLTNVIYLDGQSSAKSKMGTLDSQDRVLLKDSNFTSLPGFTDLHRAEALCDLSPQVQGFIRMEFGFEIIVCNFSSSLEYIGTTAIEPSNRNQTDDMTRDAFIHEGEHIRGVTHRYGGIGAGRVLVDYSSMISVYFYPLNLTNPDPTHIKKPRINLGDLTTIDSLKSDVLALMNRQELWSKRVNWQGVADLIVTRYSDRLVFLESIETSQSDMISELKFLLEHFIDFSHIDIAAAKDRCAAQYLVPKSTLSTATDELIYHAIRGVSEEICRVLFEAQQELFAGDNLGATLKVKQSIRALMSWLNWSTWLECGKCRVSEVCYIAIWPNGNKEDHYRPGCISIVGIFSRFGYWDYGR